MLKVLVAVLGFVMNINTLMIPELLKVQRYIQTNWFSQDHLELLFNSIIGSSSSFNN